MLEYVRKRNGTIEKADASKINLWVTNLSKDLKDRLEWSKVLMEVVKESPSEMSSQDLQLAISKKFVAQKDWPGVLMGGRFYAIWHWKNMFGDSIPTVKEHHKQMVALSLMEDMGYTDEDYEQIEQFIDHNRDLSMAQFQLKQVIYKYGLVNRLSNDQKETPQFTYMRMACALAKLEPKETKIKTVKEYYDAFSQFKINAPTPNFTNLGTPHRGYASCCLITSGDTAPSLAAADHAAYVMTYMSAGIGRFLETRSEGDPIRNGTIVHQGKMPYFNAGAGAVTANVQGGRGGSDTEYVSIFDPEIKTIIMAQNPLTPIKKQQRGIHFAISYNSFFILKAARKENIFTFNCFTAPDLQIAFFDKDINKFIDLYNKYEADESFVKNYISASELLIAIENQRHEVSTLYTFDAHRANVHSPFIEPVKHSNLCGEIVNMTKPYPSAEWLYKTDHRNGEIGICNIAAVPVNTIKSDEEYEQICYLILKMIDNIIDMSHYELPHVGYTCKNRRNAAVGMVGIADYFAARGIQFDSPYGYAVTHQLAERHLYFVAKASLRLAKERGVAPWINETRWPTGWMPFDDYKKALDEVTPHKLKYDWDTLRADIVATGGIRNSTLVAHMPAESSSKATGCSNGTYPIRELFLKKTDGSNTLDWVPINSDLHGENYQLAYDIDPIDLYKYYGVLQKFCDQSNSADTYEDRVKNPVLESNLLIKRAVARAKYGVVTNYYQNSLTTNPEALDIKGNEPSDISSSDLIGFNQRADCGAGGCTL